MQNILEKYKVPQLFAPHQDNDLGNIVAWNQEAFNRIQQSKLTFFKNCIFQTQDILDLYQTAGQMALALSIVYLESRESADEIIALLAYAINKNKIPDTAPKLLPYSINTNDIKYGNDRWRDKLFRIVKHPDDEQTMTAPTGFRPTDQTSFVDWVEGFDATGALKKYQKDIEIGGALYLFNHLDTYFDLTYLFKTNVLDPDKFPRLALFPVVIHMDGYVTNGGDPGNYVTYLMAPLDTANEIQLGPFNEEFIISGCTYPRPWNQYSGGQCTNQQQSILISDILQMT